MSHTGHHVGGKSQMQLILVTFSTWIYRAIGSIIASIYLIYVFPPYLASHFGNATNVTELFLKSAHGSIAVGARPHFHPTSYPSIRG